MTRLAIFVSSFCYVGFSPVAPGTAGSAAGLVLYWLLRRSGSAGLEAAAIVGLFAVGCWSATVAERQFGTDDPGQVVLDEVVGMLVTLAYLPFSWRVVVLGFVLFRVFDIFKPYPGSRAERLPAGLGVMADDAVVAVYANLLLRLGIWLAPGWLV